MKLFGSTTCWLTLLTLIGSAPALASTNRALRTEFDRAISKWIARDSQGKYYFVSILPGSDRKPVLAIRVAKGSTANSLEDFSEPMEPAFSFPANDPVFSTGMVIDSQDYLHLCVNTEKGWTGYSVVDLKSLKAPQDLKQRGVWLNPQNRQPGVLVLAPTSSRLGDITVSPAGEAWLTWTIGRAEHQVSVNVGGWSEGRWSQSNVTGGYGIAPPSIFIDSHNNFHLIWHDVYEDIYYLTSKLDELGSKQELQARKVMHDSFRPVMTEASNRILAVTEANYSYLNYLFPQDRAPARNGLTQKDLRFVWDTTHSPQIATDRYGIPWMFFIDNVRQHVFYTRWLGTEWSDIYNSYWLTSNMPRGDDNHLAIERVSVEEKMSPSASGIGVAVANESMLPQIEFHTLPVPSLEAKPGKKVLFMDLAEIQEWDGLVLKVDQAKKYLGNPVINVGEPNDFDSQQAGSQAAQVIKENGLYRMWYAAWHKQRGRPWWIDRRIGYAESRDGYHFEKVKVGTSSAPGSSNLIADIPWIIRVPICFDPADPDPNRRYKILRFPPFPPQDEEAKTGAYDPWHEVINGNLYTSRDGIHWASEKAETSFAAGKTNELMPLSFFRDDEEKDPRKRFKAYGYLVLNLSRRGGSYSYSADGIHWTAHPQNPVLDPFARDIPVVRGGKVHQVHDSVVWKEGDYYLALYEYQRDGDALDIELAASRDGENFVFVKPGEKVIPLGSPGEWDCAFLTTTAPFLDKDELKIYYGGVCGGEEGKGGAGLATLRPDGYTHLQLTAQRKAGNFTTIPIAAGPATRLIVNADCGPHGHLEVELIDPATKRFLDGFSRADAVPVTGQSTAQVVQWKQRGDLRGIGNRSFQIRVYFEGESATPKLYSFRFE